MTTRRRTASAISFSLLVGGDDWEEVIRDIVLALSLLGCVLLPAGGGNAQETKETKLSGFVFETPVECTSESLKDCSMVSFQIYGEAAVLIFEGMQSEISQEPDICLEWHYKSDQASGLICYVSEDRTDGLCTFGYDFSSRKMLGWAGSC